MSDQAGFQTGAFVSPLTAATTNSLLQDADPALYQALAFYQAVIATHLAARFDAEVTASGLTSLAGKITTLAIPYDPLPFLLQAQLVPPFLALFVVGEKTTDRTRAWYQIEADWKLQWVLPPLTAAQYLRLYPFLRAAAKVVVDRTNLGYDPSYQDGALFCDLGGIEQLDLGPVRYGSIQGLKSELFFPTVEFELTAFERRMSTPGLQTLTRVDGTITTIDPTGPAPVDENEDDMTTTDPTPLDLIDYEDITS